MDSAKFTLDFHVPEFEELFRSSSPWSVRFSQPEVHRMLHWSICVRPSAPLVPKTQDHSIMVFLNCHRKDGRVAGPWECKAKFKIILKNQVGQPEKDYSQSLDYTFTNTELLGRVHGDWSFLQYDELVKEDSGFVVDNSIQIQIEVTPGIPIGLHYEEKLAALSPHSSTSISTSLHFLETGQGSDFTIVSRDKRKFRVHREILAKKSEVLATMFEADMKEARTETLVMEDMGQRGLKALLRFLYTGDTTLVEDAHLRIVKELINAAEKYGLADLKTYCGYLLVEGCTEKNALNLYKFASRFGLEGAKKEIFKFAQDHFKDVWKVLADEEEQSDSPQASSDSDSGSKEIEMDDDDDEERGEDDGHLAKKMRIE